MNFPFVFMLGFLSTGSYAKSDCTVTKKNVDCQSMKFKDVPDNLPHSIAKINLNDNGIVTLTTASFSSYLDLEEVYLSHNAIVSIANGTFDALQRLQVLDLTLNKLTYASAVFPLGLLDKNPRLTSLYLAGQFGESKPDEAVKAILQLDELKHLSISPSGSSLHPELARLSKLRVLDFQWGNINGPLRRTMLDAFVELPLTEISFHSCGITDVEEGVFNDFSQLELINMACNYDLDPTRVILSLSNTQNISVTSLILDATGANADVTLGPVGNETCKQSWSQLLRLSMGGVNIDTYGRWGPCAPKLQEIILSYSTIYSAFKVDPRKWQSNLMNLPMNVKTARLSHFLEYNKKHTREALQCEQMSSPRNSQGYFQTPAIADICTSPSNKKVRFGPLQMISRGCFLYPTAAPHKCLQHVDVSYLSLNRNAPFMNCGWFPPNQIKVLNASHCARCVDRLKGPMVGLTELEILDSSFMNLRGIGWDLCIDFPSLTELYLQENKRSVDGIGPFPKCTKLKVLDLSHNELEYIPMSVFDNISALDTLSLRGNRLQNVSFLNNQFPTLKFLDLSHNKLQHLTKDETAALERIHRLSNGFVLDLSANSLQCDCAVINFISWAQTTSIHILDVDRLNCMRNGKIVFMEDINIFWLRIQCTNLVKNITSSMAVALVVLITSAVSYQKRWAIKWYYYKMMRGIGKTRTSTSTDRTDQQTHAFVLYCFRDDYARQWVYRTLRPKVEEEWQLNLYLLGRNDVPGEYGINNLVDGLKSSRKAIWVLTPEFLSSFVCVNGAHFAICHLGAAFNLVVSFGDNEVCPENIPGSLRSLLDPKMNTRRAKFCGLDAQYRLFWAKMQEYLLDEDDVQNADSDVNQVGQGLMSM